MAETFTKSINNRLKNTWALGRGVYGPGMTVSKAKAIIVSVKNHLKSSPASQSQRNKYGKVLWTRKAPACLLTLLYAYGKARLCINIHHYAPPATAAATAAGRSTLHYTHRVGSVLVKVQCQVLNR